VSALLIIILVQIVNAIAWLLTLLIIVDAVLSYFMSPFQPFRQTLDRLVEPMYRPIRKVIPPIGMLDLTPLILIILIQIIQYVLVTLLYLV
jgi:YggT family protein